MDSIGETLRLERLRHGLDLEQLAAQTCIGRQFLEAMEANHFERLPGGLFTRSFLRQYARVLQLDEEQLVVCFKEQFEEPDLPLPLPPPKSPFRRLSLLATCSCFVIALMFCGGVYEFCEKVGASKPRSTPLHRIESAAALAIGNLPPVQTATPPAAEKLTPKPPPTELSRPSGEPSAKPPIRVVFTATEPVWLSINSDGTHVYAGLLSEHQSKDLTAKDKLVALVGNAGGLRVILNDKAAPPIGAHGEVRLLSLTADGIRVTNTLATKPSNLNGEQQPNKQQPPDEEHQF